ncbi:MAG: CAP domain-containing protein [Deltaproteobacteria bacterium]
MKAISLALFILLTQVGASFAATCELIGNTGTAFAEANAFRARAGSAPLKVSPALEKAAQTYACDMARRSFFSHHSPEGQGVTGRATSVGFKGRCVGENIARGLGIVQSPVAVMRGWEASPGHRQQLLAKRYDIAGLAGVKIGKNGYWVMIFGGCTGSIFETFP